MRLLVAMVYAVGALVALQVVLGSCGLLGTASAWGVLAVSVTVGWVTWARTETGPSAGWTPTEVGLATAVAAGVGVGLWANRSVGLYPYDVLSYHLPMATTWLQAGRIVLVPAVFGDVSPTYNPSDVELVFAWLAGLRGDDLLARCGQLGFAALGAVAIAAAVSGDSPDHGPEPEAPVRTVGVTRRAAGLAAALGWLLVPEAWFQARTAMVDLAVASFFACCLPFLARLWSAPTRRDAVGLAISTGLLFGSKFTGPLLWAPVGLGLAFCFVRWRARLQARHLLDLAVLLGIVIVTGGFWYLRNLWVAGNPLFPVATSLFGVQLFAGVYDTQLMRAWMYHHPVSDLATLGRNVLGGGVGLCVAAALAFPLRRRGPEPWVAAVLLVALWCVVPYQHARFFLPLFGVALIAVGRAAASSPPTLARLLLATPVIGALVEGFEPERLIPAGVGLGGAALAAAGVRPRGILAAGGALVLGLLVWPTGPTERRLAVPGAHLQPAWAWVEQNVRGANIAYTGANLPFPLHGPRFVNRVEYVNVGGAADARLHDHFRVALVPASTAEPPIYRQIEDYDTWSANLTTRRIDLLFVSILHAPQVAAQIRHDVAGFPIERAWADAHPGRFALVWANAGVRIYAVRREPEDP